MISQQVIKKGRNYMAPVPKAWSFEAESGFETVNTYGHCGKFQIH